MNYLAKSLIQNIFSRLPNKLGTYLYRRLQNRYSFKFNEVNEKAKFYKAYNSVLLSNVSGEDFNEKRLYNAGTFQIVGSALNICPESIPKGIKKDYEKSLKALIKKTKK